LFVRPTQNWKHVILWTLLFAGAENTNMHTKDRLQGNCRVD
jgi:hypothetical protein